MSNSSVWPLCVHQLEWNHGFIAWAFHGRCGGSAAHFSEQLLSTHTFGTPRNHSAACALCVGCALCIPHTLCGRAHFAAHAFCGPWIDILLHAIFDPFSLQNKQIMMNTIKRQFVLRPRFRIRATGMKYQSCHKLVKSANALTDF